MSSSRKETEPARWRFADQTQPRHLLKASDQIVGQGLLMLVEPLPILRHHKVDGGSEADSASDMGSARFELEGQGIEGGAAETDPIDHLATGLPGRHPLQ